jgi:hypothetical protein
LIGPREESAWSEFAMNILVVEAPYDPDVANALAGDEGPALDPVFAHDIGGDAVHACLSLCTLGERRGYMP